MPDNANKCSSVLTLDDMWVLLPGLKHLEVVVHSNLVFLSPEGSIDALHSLSVAYD